MSSRFVTANVREVGASNDDVSNMEVCYVPEQNCKIAHWGRSSQGDVDCKHYWFQLITILHLNRLSLGFIFQTLAQHHLLSRTAVLPISVLINKVWWAQRIPRELMSQWSTHNTGQRIMVVENHFCSVQIAQTTVKCHSAYVTVHPTNILP